MCYAGLYATFKDESEADFFWKIACKEGFYGGCRKRNVSIEVKEGNIMQQINKLISFFSANKFETKDQSIMLFFSNNINSILLPSSVLLELSKQNLSLQIHNSISK